MLSNVWLSMPSSCCSGPGAPSALLSEAHLPSGSAARCFARRGLYALAASFLLRLPTVHLESWERLVDAEPEVLAASVESTSEKKVWPELPLFKL